jgi:hypothetical protein
MQDLGLITRQEVETFGGNEQMAYAYQKWVADGRHKTKTGILERIGDFLGRTIDALKATFGSQEAKQANVLRGVDAGKGSAKKEARAVKDVAVIQKALAKPAAVKEDGVAKAARIALEPPGSVTAQLLFGKEEPIGVTKGVHSVTTARGKTYNFDAHTFKLADGRERVILSAGDPRELVDAAAVVRKVQGGVIIETIHAGITGFNGLGGVLAKLIHRKYGKIIADSDAPLSAAGKRATGKLAKKESDVATLTKALAAPKPATVDTPEFKQWFGQSKVVDDAGKPLRVFHGTPKAGFSGFHAGSMFTSNTDLASEYAIGTLERRQQQKNKSPGTYPAYLKIERPLVLGEEVRQPPVALLQKIKGLDVGLHNQILQDKAWSAGYEIPEFLNSGRSADDKTAVSDKMIKALTTLGYDGVVFFDSIPSEGRIFRGMSGRHRVYVAFSPNQIKSATGNKGTFDQKNPDIRYRRPRTRHMASKSDVELFRKQLIARGFAVMEPVKELFAKENETRRTVTRLSQILKQRKVT